MTNDPFDLLGLPPVFELDAANVQRAYLSRAAAIHPDLIGDDEESALRSAALNKAQAVIHNPEQRANILLTRLGGQPKEQDKSLPPGFLIEMMETREAIEAAIATNTPGERANWESWAQEQRTRYINTVAGLFKALGAPPSTDGLRAIRRELNAWRYIERLIEQLDPQYDPARRDFADEG